MPTYEYLCLACGHVHEVIHRMMERGPAKCSKCGWKTPTKRLSANIGLVFKGEGFYVNDYPKERDKKDA